MPEPFENMYFNWLCAKVSVSDNSTPTLRFYQLLGTLHNTQFVWLLSGDDNRAADGLELRREFILAGDFPDDPQWRTFEECSIFEMMIAFARRAEFQTDIPVSDWFWEFLDNLGLKEFNDEAINQGLVDDILNTLIWRTYDYNGYGGMFPLDHPGKDQRDVEIWYQFCAYLIDQDRLV